MKTYSFCFIAIKRNKMEKNKEWNENDHRVEKRPSNKCKMVRKKKQKQRREGSFENGFNCFQPNAVKCAERRKNKRNWQSQIHAQHTIYHLLCTIHTRTVSCPTHYSYEDLCLMPLRPFPHSLSTQRWTENWRRHTSHHDADDYEY